QYVEQPWWTDCAVFKIRDDPFRFSPTNHFVVAAADGSAFDLTGDTSPAALDPRPLARFDALSRAHRLRLQSLRDAERYVSFVLDAYLGNDGAYMRAEQVQACLVGTMVPEDEGISR